MQPDGSYAKQDLRGKEKLDSQMYFVKKASEGHEPVKSAENSRVFIPVESSEEK